MDSFSLNQPERSTLVILCLVGALFLVWLSYRQSPLPLVKKVLAMVCKFSALSLLALMLLDPQWTRIVPRKGANEVVIAADNGARMTVAEKTGEVARGSAMREALSGRWKDELDELFRVKSMVFDDRLKSVKDFSGLKFDGRGSALVSALKSMGDRSGGRATAAVVVFTDGVTPDAANWEKARSNLAPVFPVVIGKGPVQRDLSVDEVRSEQSSFEESPVTLTAKVKAYGFEEKEAVLVVLDEAGKVVGMEKHRFERAESGHVFRARVAHVKQGLAFYRLMVMESGLEKKLAADEWKKLSVEANIENNQRTISVDRGSGPYRVLYVSGRPNWEYKFMRRALAGDADIQLPSLIRIAKSEPKFEWRGRAGETSNPLFRGFKAEGGDEAQRYDQPVWIRLGTRDKQELSDGFPKTEENLLGEYRAIIIDDLEAAAFTMEQMNLIERFVSQRGGAVLMLGGQESFRGGGYDHTPIGRMLPVYLDRAGEGSFIQNVRLDLTKEGWLEPWTRLRVQQEDDETRLSEMPPFFALNPTLSIKPGASVLATAYDVDQKAHPALVVQRFGEGRVGALMVGDQWRWGMESPEKRADMEKAWRQLMRWLVVDVPDRLVLEQSRESVNGQERVLLQVRVKDGAFRAVDDATIKMKIQQPDKASVELFVEPSPTEPGVFQADYFPRMDGAYRAKVEIKDGKGAVLGERETGWVYEPVAEEFRTLKPNREFLQRIATDTGGQLLELDDVSRLPSLLASLDVPIQETVSSPLWHTPWIFLLILGLLATEWIIRRRFL
jgi:uncharacterized membrane protein